MSQSIEFSHYELDLMRVALSRASCLFDQDRAYYRKDSDNKKIRDVQMRFIDALAKEYETEGGVQFKCIDHGPLKEYVAIIDGE